MNVNQVSGTSTSLPIVNGLVVNNDEHFLWTAFPELMDRGLTLVTAQFTNTDLAYGADTELQGLVTRASYENITFLKRHLQQQGISHPRILSLIDLQKDFLNGGSLMVPGAEEKVFHSIAEVLEENAQRIRDRKEPLFHAIIMTKDFHPANHLSFTKTFFDLSFEILNGKRTFLLKPNAQGEALGVKIRTWWTQLPHISAKLEFTSHPYVPNAFYLTPKSVKDYDKLKRELSEGKIMPFSRGFHPIAVTGTMFEKIEGINARAILQKLKGLEDDQGEKLLDNRNRINPQFRVANVPLKDAFTVPNSFPPTTEWNPAVIQYFSEQLEEPRSEAILNALLEDFWPNHCVQGEEGHQFHETLMDLLEKNASNTPILPFPKGTSLQLGESYSGVFNTAGYCATPYAAIMKFLEPESVIVAGTATGYCPSTTALHTKRLGFATTYWVNASKGITEPEEEATHKLLAERGITVVPDFRQAHQSIPVPVLPQAVPPSLTQEMVMNFLRMLSATPMGSSLGSLIPQVFSNQSSTSSSTSQTHQTLASPSSSTAQAYAPLASTSTTQTYTPSLLDEYFNNYGQINSQATLPNFGANILIGPQTEGFADKIPVPFCFASIGEEECRNRIIVKDEPRFTTIRNNNLVDVVYKDAHPSFLYDTDHSLKKEFSLDFDANMSERASINLPAEALTKLGIDTRAKSYAFVYPMNAMGSTGFDEVAAKKKISKDELFSQIASRLKSQFGEDFASLMIIGGYAYFSQSGELIQVKSIVPRATNDILHVGKPLLNQRAPQRDQSGLQSTGIIPKELWKEFESSVEQLKMNFGRDGLSNPITAPELLSYGATHFAYVPQGYYPAAVQGASDAVKARYNSFWSTVAPYGLFIYKFKNPQHDCILPLVDGKEEKIPEGKIPVQIVKFDGKDETVNASVEKTCLVCQDALPNVVYQLKDIERNERGRVVKTPNYVAVCCSECNRGLDNNNRKVIAYKSEVLGVYNATINLQNIKSDFYDVLHVQPVTRFYDVKMNEMASSKNYALTLVDKKASNIPERATEFAFLYPAEQLKHEDPQVSAVYKFGGFAYYRNGSLVGINYFAPNSQNGAKALAFEDLKEISLLPQDKQEFMNLIQQKKLPFVTVKALRAKGVMHFMWIPPYDRRFNSPNGQFIYFNVDGTKVYAKPVATLSKSSSSTRGLF